MIVARSANLLARAAQSAGCEHVVVDAYGDSDTRAMALDYRRLNFVGETVDFDSLRTSIGEIESLYGELPILWGGGWESSGHILCALNETHEVLGSHPHALLRLSDPNWYKCLFAGSDSQYFAPAVFAKNSNPGLLIKARQRSGGHAVREVAGEQFLPKSEYFQPALPGRSISALCVADGNRVRVIGWSAHFKLQHNKCWNYRHSACVSIPSINPPAHLLSCLQRAMEYLGLFGIFGCDFIQGDGGKLKLVDVNPRVTATAPLHLKQEHLLKLHLSPTSSIERRSWAGASAVVYADIPTRITKTLNWPPWASDRPSESRVYHSAEPLCTIHSCAENTEAAKILLIERFKELMQRLKQAQ